MAMRTGASERAVTAWILTPKVSLNDSRGSGHGGITLVQFETWDREMSELI
jgi:hypothetical protein